jgi:hypothetical protein
MRSLFGCGSRRVVAVSRRDFSPGTVRCCIPERNPLDFAPRRVQRGSADGKPPETARMGGELTAYRTEG